MIKQVHVGREQAVQLLGLPRHASLPASWQAGSRPASETDSAWRHGLSERAVLGPQIDLSHAQLVSGGLTGIWQPHASTSYVLLTTVSVISESKHYKQVRFMQSYLLVSFDYLDLDAGAPHSADNGCGSDGGISRRSASPFHPQSTSAANRGQRPCVRPLIAPFGTRGPPISGHSGLYLPRRTRSVVLDTALCRRAPPTYRGSR